MDVRSSPWCQPTTLSQALVVRRDRDSASVGLCVRAFFTLLPHQLVFPGVPGVRCWGRGGDGVWWYGVEGRLEGS